MGNTQANSDTGTEASGAAVHIGAHAMWTVARRISWQGGCSG
jgi:hypothetical protein